MVIKRGFSAFWRWSCRKVLLYFDRPLEKFETVSVPENTLKILPLLTLPWAWTIAFHDIEFLVADMQSFCAKKCVISSPVLC